jgi:hypothetical protein
MDGRRIGQSIETCTINRQLFPDAVSTRGGAVLGRDPIGPDSPGAALEPPDGYYDDNAFPDERDHSEFREEVRTGDGRVAFIYTQKACFTYQAGINHPNVKAQLCSSYLVCSFGYALHLLCTPLIQCSICFGQGNQL